MRKHKILVGALIGFVVLSILIYPRYNIRLHYARVIFSEKSEEVLGLGKTAKTEILYAQERFTQSEEKESDQYPPAPASTITKSKLTGGKLFYGSDVTTTLSNKAPLRQSQFSHSIWDSRFENLTILLNGSSTLSCGSGKVFLVAVVGDDFLWEKKFKVLEDNTLSVNPYENATLWVKSSGGVGEDLYQSFLLNQSMSYLIQKVVVYWLSGEIRVYPIKEAKEIMSCVEP